MMWIGRKALIFHAARPIHFEIFFKKVLDKAAGIWYSTQARPTEVGKRAKRTLKTIQRRNAQRKEDSEDSEE